MRNTDGALGLKLKENNNLKQENEKMYKGTQEIRFTKNGLRYASVVNEPSFVIDQYGRVFETGGPKNKYGYDEDGMKSVESRGYATH